MRSTSTVDEYLSAAVPNMMTVKYHFFGNETVVMHGQKIRKRSGAFEILSDAEVLENFHAAMTWALEQLNGCLIVAAVHKERHVGQYITPGDPFFLSLQFLLERLYMHWTPQLIGGRRLLCVFEARGKNEDAQTLEWFSEICDGNNYRGQRFPFDADFRPKEANVVGHQYADLAAYAACKYVETGDEERRDWLAVKSKLRTVGGRFESHGLKVFP